MATLANGTTVTDRRLGRLPQFDERSRAFGIRETLPALIKPRSYTWSCPVWLDQGNEGSCVGFSIAQEAAARPVKVKDITNSVGREIYHRAQTLDPWEGEDYEGTSVLAGIKAAKERGWYGEYRWAFGLNDLILALGYKGPAVLGINWYSSMSRPDASGLIKISGNVDGGHAIMANGVKIVWLTGTTEDQKFSPNWLSFVDKSKSFARLHNSWGEDWGIFGDCFIGFNDLDRLLHEQGEGVIPTHRGFGNELEASEPT